MPYLWIALGSLAFLLGMVAIYDLLQRRHAILRNFPIIGHLRYMLEAIGPELRQYIVTDNDEERPFSRDERRWVYASSKRENNYFGFGTDNDIEDRSNYLLLRHSPFPLGSPLPGESGYDPQWPLPSAKVLGGARGRARAMRPASAIYVSGMSFGSLGSAAVEALNRGCALAAAMHNTGEGGISSHHLHGGELVLQVGTGYFGCRDEQGRFSMARLRETVERHPQVRAIEIKLSQGAKPGLGGLLPRAKITPEIARARGVPADRDCVSPPAHSAFSCPDSLLDFVESIASETGLPVGIKSAVGQLDFWRDLARLMAAGERGVDFVVIDGGEGGTGAAPLVFSDHVSLPFKLGFPRVFGIFADAGVAGRIVFGGSGRLGLPIQAAFAFALGCDLVGVAREAMLAIGCIQAQRCHTGHCPAGVATHNRWLMGGLDPTLKAARLANYLATLRMEVTKLCHAAGVCHPAFLTTEHFEVLDGRMTGGALDALAGYAPHTRRPGVDDCADIARIMNGR